MGFYVGGSDIALAEAQRRKRINLFVSQHLESIYWHMKQVIAFLNQPLFAAVATLITIGSLVILKFPEQKRPFFTAKSSTINIDKINNNFSTNIIELNHLSNCKKMDDLSDCKKWDLAKITTTRIMLWNGGRETIDKTDIDDNPLKIIPTDNTEILDVALLDASNPSNNVVVDNSNNIYFSFLEAKDGFVIDIIHTGTSEKNIAIKGYIKNSKFNDNFKYINNSDLYSTENHIILAFVYISIVILSFFLLSFGSKKITELLRQIKINNILFYIVFQSVQTAVCLILPLFILVVVREKNAPFFLRVPNDLHQVFDAE